MGYILLTWLLGQQVHGAEIVDIGNITDIANTAKETGRRNMVEIGRCIGVTGVSCDSTPLLNLKQNMYRKGEGW